MAVHLMQSSYTSETGQQDPRDKKHNLKFISGLDSIFFLTVKYSNHRPTPRSTFHPFTLPGLRSFRPRSESSEDPFGFAFGLFFEEGTLGMMGPVQMRIPKNS